MQQQSAEQRAHIREEYHKMRLDVRENYPEYVENTERSNTNLTKMLQKSKDSYLDVQHPREAVLDAKLLTSLGGIVQTKCNKLSVSFNSTDFANKIINYLDGDLQTSITPAGWTKLGRQVQPLIKSTARFTYLNGSFDPGATEQKAPKPRNTQRKKDAIGEKTAPKQLKELSTKDNEETTTEEVDWINNYLNYFCEEWKGPVCYYQFVCNPHSFGKTVENMFYTSFLVKDGLAAIYLDDNKLPVIEARVPVEKQGTVLRKQIIMNISIPQWKKIIKEFKITKQLIPNRSDRK